MDLSTIADKLVAQTKEMRFREPVTHVYNPLIYARLAYDQYTRTFGSPKKEIVLVGMNPGPFGMAQCGIPFGDTVMVKEWMGIRTDISKPAKEHPKRIIDGFDCPRREVSGSRLWGWAQEKFGTPQKFFERFFVLNYCPLCFMEESGRNRTPDKLPKAEREPLLEVCDKALRDSIKYLRPDYVIGVGGFAEKRIEKALKDFPVTFGRIPHPSPASPVANRGWSEAATKALHEQGILV